MTFRKTGSPDAVATEAASLRWLAEADGGAAVAELVDVGDDWLTTRLLADGSPTPDDARAFGARLAHTHGAGAEFWGQAPPGLDASRLRLAELDAPAADQPRWDTFGEFYAEARLRPYFHPEAFSSDARLVAELLDRISEGEWDSPQPALVDGVARIHGDLWQGNVLWPAGEGTLIDPCAHGGHAETDLAELGVFGAPHLDAIIEGYCEVSPLADGWQQRVGLHQLHMVLVHVTLFGGGYVGQALSIARELTR